MTVVVSKASVLRTLGWMQVTLATCGMLALCYCGYVLADAWLFQEREAQQFAASLRAPAPETPSATDGLSGRMEIPRLNVSVMVAPGVDERSLRRAVGHIPGTGMPGQPGNVGIAGHRDTFFRPLRNIQRYDMITLTTLRGEFRYRVVSARVVDPGEVEVLEASSTEVLTLVTCYPFYFVGTAPNRFVVRAERVI